jgi:hypothetical protein
LLLFLSLLLCVSCPRGPTPFLPVLVCCLVLEPGPGCAAGSPGGLPGKPGEAEPGTRHVQTWSPPSALPSRALGPPWEGIAIYSQPWGHPQPQWGPDHRSQVQHPPFLILCFLPDLLALGLRTVGTRHRERKDCLRPQPAVHCPFPHPRLPWYRARRTQAALQYAN